MSVNMSSSESSVLLVCIYNQFGNIITHDYLYQLFCPYGSIVKILIFQKAKVWKTFVEYQYVKEAQQALENLNNKIIFQDGSKMNIFRSKLKHVQFQNDNLGGVNYLALKQQQEITSLDMTNRKRRSTFQDYIVPFYGNETSQAYYNFVEKDHDLSSTSAKYKSQSLSAKKQEQNSSFNNFMDIDQQFRELALQSQQFRYWQQNFQINRRKSKTIVNPNSQQFLLQNCPSKVLFVRSIPQAYDHDCIYNIFSNFGNINKVIFIKQKSSALIEYDSLINAVKAKDQINYAKAIFKVFYSHYQSLILKKIDENQEQHEYKSEGTSRPHNYNPPSQVLYMTMMHPKNQQQIKDLCALYGCKLYDLQWKQNGKDKWMCLLQFQTLEQSLLIMGKLQGYVISNGKKIRLSFTRSRLKKKQLLNYFNNNQYDNVKY